MHLEEGINTLQLRYAFNLVLAFCRTLSHAVELFRMLSNFVAARRTLCFSVSWWCSVVSYIGSAV